MNKEPIEYDIFAPFYDAVMGEPKETVTLLNALVNKYNSSAKSVLELACGTGNILIGLGNKYERVGLDRSQGMLSIARKKAPDVQFVKGDMENFELGRKFDVILCIFDSINHLTDFSQWESLFQHAREHLTEGGILIFDMNTITKLKRLSQTPPFEQQFDHSKMVIRVTDKGNDIYNWSVRILERLRDRKEIAHEENILETAFEIDKVKTTLGKYLAIGEVMDSSRKEVSPESERVYFVGCAS